MAITTSIAPWLSIRNAAKAVAFYKTAFGAEETYRMEEGGLVVRLSVNGAEFWVSGELDANDAVVENIATEHIRMILTVADPETLFTRALQAGAAEIFPVGEEYGWRLGRLADPFGLQWEIGHELK